MKASERLEIIIDEVQTNGNKRVVQVTREKSWTEILKKAYGVWGKQTLENIS